MKSRGCLYTECAKQKGKVFEAVPDREAKLYTRIPGQKSSVEGFFGERPGDVRYR